MENGKKEKCLFSGRNIDAVFFFLFFSCENVCSIEGKKLKNLDIKLQVSADPVFLRSGATSNNLSPWRSRCLGHNYCVWKLICVYHKKNHS